MLREREVFLFHGVSYTGAMSNLKEKNEFSHRPKIAPETIDIGVSPDDDRALEDVASRLAVSSRRGIYLLPNLFTTGALAGGFYAILAGLGGHFEAAAIAIFVAMLFDGLDGRGARLTNTQSEFGVEYDSLSDMVSFGVAPAVLMYVWSLEPLGTIGWSVSFIYVSCAALRLARFNARVDDQDNRYFYGLASPAAAAVIASMVWSGTAMSTSWFSALLPAILTGVIGLLMVSNVRYLSFKQINFARRVPIAVMLGLSLVVSVIMIDPPRVLLGLSLVYAFYSPIFAAIKSARKFSVKTLRGRFRQTAKASSDEASSPKENVE